MVMLLDKKKCIYSNWMHTEILCACFIYAHLDDSIQLFFMQYPKKHIKTSGWKHIYWNKRKTLEFPSFQG